MSTKRASKPDWRANRNSELSDLLRGRILEAARRCLELSGFARLRMEQVAREADCSRGTLYRYFSNKEEILLSIAIGNFQRIVEEVQAEIASIKDPRLRFATGLSRAMELAMEDDFTLPIDLVNRAIQGDSGGLRAVVSAVLAPFMEEARKAGQLRSGMELEEATNWIIQVATGLLNTGWPAVGGKPMNPGEQVSYLCRFLLYPVFDLRDLDYTLQHNNV